MFLLVTTLLKFAVFVLLFVMPLASLLTWMERRQSAYSQDRYGPYKATLKLFGKDIQLAGLLHIAADGLKMFFKEPFIPSIADKAVFKLAPAIGFVTAMLTLALVPFGPDLKTADIPLLASWFPDLVAAHPVIPLQMARVDAGLLFIFAIGSLSVYSAALAGWASNNRYALMGGLRAAAQGISYEIALGLTVVGVLIAFGSTELAALVRAQAQPLFGPLPAWGVFIQPLAAVLFFVAAIAETKRGPFDLPEGESEIIGYFMEYSSMGFGLFMLSEFVEIVVLACVFTTLFLGGWEFPWLVGDTSIYLGFTSIEVSTFGRAIAGMIVFGAKVFFLCALQLQIRWTLPRFRYDQLMHLGWKTILPLSLVNIFVTAVLMWLDPERLVWLGYLGIAEVVAFAFVVIAGPRRTEAMTEEAHGGHGATHGTAHAGAHDAAHAHAATTVTDTPAHQPAAHGAPLAARST
jgi:NADH-quinone oxidoreductase subunit H